MSMSTRDQRFTRTNGDVVVRILYGAEDCAVAGSRGPGYSSGLAHQCLKVETTVGDDLTPGAGVAGTLDEDKLRGGSACTNAIDGRLHLKEGYLACPTPTALS